eukprot:7754406-Pyramimonas_sp.AAC.1
MALNYAGPASKANYQEEFETGSSIILLPNIRANMFRGTGIFRTEVPAHIIRLRGMYERVFQVPSDFNDDDVDVDGAAVPAVALTDLLEAVDNVGTRSCHVCGKGRVHDPLLDEVVDARECALCG